jgi:hypothetical protein
MFIVILDNNYLILGLNQLLLQFFVGAGHYLVILICDFLLLWNVNLVLFNLGLFALLGVVAAGRDAVVEIVH